MISQEVFLEAEAPYSTGLAGGFFTLKITIQKLPHHMNAAAFFLSVFEYCS